jgi:hypothetical protein
MIYLRKIDLINGKIWKKYKHFMFEILFGESVFNVVTVVVSAPEIDVRNCFALYWITKIYLL